MRRPVCVLLAAALLPACGGTRSGDAPEQPRLTQQEFVERANGVCIASDRRVFRIGDLSSNPAGWAKTVAAAARGIAQMRALRPPAARQGQFDAMLADARRLKDALASVRDALRDRDLAQAQAAQRRATAFDTKIKHRAARLGLTFCEQLLTNWPA